MLFTCDGRFCSIGPVSLLPQKVVYYIERTYYGCFCLFVCLFVLFHLYLPVMRKRR